MSATYSFRSIENMHDTYRRKDCMEKFCEFLRQHTTELINSEKKNKFIKLKRKK